MVFFLSLKHDGAMKNEVDAYRYFFPAGVLLGLWGVILWILFPWNLVGYPGLRHPEIMMGGFFLCFVCGFLMTAAPKFTDSFGPQIWEHRLGGILILALFASLTATARTYFFVASLGLFLFLAVYLLRRFAKRRQNPPDPFIFVGAGLFSGIAGNSILLVAEFATFDDRLFQLGRGLFLQAYILCLVLGVGSRLIPALTGRAPLPTEGAYRRGTLLGYTGLAVLFVLSYILESYVSSWVGNLLRALVISVILLHYWGLYKYPSRRAYQSFWLWISGWSILLAQWALVFLPDYRVHLLHVLYVSGLATMTLMIAVRVGLSHGKHDLALEKSSKALWLGAFLIVVAGLTRLSAGFAPHIYQSHLLYAAWTWVLGLFVWGWVYLPRIVRVKRV